MPGTQLGQALTLPNLPGQPNGLALAPRVRALRENLVLLGLGFRPVFRPLKGAGP